MRNKEQEELLEMVPELNFDESFAKDSHPQKNLLEEKGFVFLIILNLLSGKSLCEFQIAYSCN